MKFVLDSNCLYSFVFLSAVDEQNEQTPDVISQCASASVRNSIKQRPHPISHILDDLPESSIDSDDCFEEKCDKDTEKPLRLENEHSESRVPSSQSPVSSQDEVDVMMTKAISKLNNEIPKLSVDNNLFAGDY